MPRDVGAEDGAAGGHEEIHVLDNVDERLVFAVLDIGASPAQGAGGLHSDATALLDHVALRLDALGGDVHFQRVRLRVLRVAKIEDLIEQFVDEDEVVFDSFFVEFAKVGFAEGDETVEEFEDEGRVGIGFGYRDDVDVFVLDVREGGGPEGEDWGADLGVGDYLDAEDVGEAGAACGEGGGELLRRTELQGGGGKVQSLRNWRKMRFSPFWLKRRTPDIMVVGVGGRRGVLRLVVDSGGRWQGPRRASGGGVMVRGAARVRRRRLTRRMRGSGIGGCADATGSTC